MNIPNKMSAVENMTSRCTQSSVTKQQHCSTNEITAKEPRDSGTDSPTNQKTAATSRDVSSTGHEPCGKRVHCSTNQHAAQERDNFVTTNHISSRVLISANLDLGPGMGPGGNPTEGDLSVYQANHGAHREGISLDEMIDYYNQWATRGTYEKDLCPLRYKGPAYTAQMCSSLVAPPLRTRMRVLDVGAGTGLVGKQLLDVGFTNLDALEPAGEMVKLAEGVYKNTWNVAMTSLHSTPIQDDTYDMIALSGAMGEGHLPCEALKEMIRIVKPGGYIVITMRSEYLSYVEEYKDRLENLMMTLRQGQYWKVIEKREIQGYSFNKLGVIFVHQVLCEGFPLTNNK